MSETIFTTFRHGRAVMRRLTDRWRKLFNVSEIAESDGLLWSLGAIILCYVLVFSVLIYDKSGTYEAFRQGSYVCWPYFQSCGRLMVLQALPFGYSQSELYMALYALLIAAVWALSRKKMAIAHLCVSAVWAWHTFATFILTYPSYANHDFFLFSFATILLFFPHKEFFLKASIALFYFLSVSVKIYPTWIAGVYFSSLAHGLPLAPDATILVFTNLVIASQIFLPWFLFSSRKMLRIGVLAFFAFFHLYSGILVGYVFPTLVLPIELILFGRFYRNEKIPFDRASIAGWVFLFLWCVAQSISFFIPGDTKLTMEADKFGHYMFEANHQCVSVADILYKDGSHSIATTTGSTHYDRCEVYKYWFRLHTQCTRDPRISGISWTFDQSLNGGPFLRIVDARDACALEFQPFSHNMWIKTEADSPTIIGYPVTNFYL